MHARRLTTCNYWLSGPRGQRQLMGRPLASVFFSPFSNSVSLSTSVSVLWNLQTPQSPSTSSYLQLLIALFRICTCASLPVTLSVCIFPVSLSSSLSLSSLFLQRFSISSVCLSRILPPFFHLYL